MLSPRILRSFLENKPQGAEIVLTGRNPPDWLIEKADYVTEMKKGKHPFDKGIKARAGIER
jgi:cob(I)alamin adenosyltransferase